MSGTAKKKSAKSARRQAPAAPRRRRAPGRPPLKTTESKRALVRKLRARQPPVPWAEIAAHRQLRCSIKWAQMLARGSNPRAIVNPHGDMTPYICRKCDACWRTSAKTLPAKCPACHSYEWSNENA